MNNVSFTETQKSMDERDDLCSEIPVLALLNAMTRITYRNFCIIDFKNQKLLYVSDNTNSLCGRSGADIQDMGFTFFQKHLPKEGYALLKEIKKATDEFLSSVPIENRANYTLSHDINIMNNLTNEYRLVNHQFTPITFHEGNIDLCLCITSIAPHNETRTIELWHKDKKKYWRYNLKSKSWNLVPPINLKSAEKEVIKLSAEGYSITEMANKMNKSFDTIKFYRKNLFRKLEADNITEALSRAMAKHLL